MSEQPTTVALLYGAAKPFAKAFEDFSDPGTSDLDNEQPVSISMTLGDWRKLRSAVAVARLVLLQEMYV
jgi:hypothetical protein